MIRKLPIYKGYTVDIRLKEFRKIPLNRLPKFIPFTGKKGIKLFEGFIKTEEGRSELDYYLNHKC